MNILTAADILQAALRLPRSDRELIARELWDSMPAPGVMSEDDPGFLEELDRRVEELNRDPSKALDWEVVKVELRERFGDSQQ
jgi:putative addiction module component (TIGR02574 family)